MSLVVRKPVFGVSDQARNKPGCTTTEDGLRLEISDFGSKGILLKLDSGQLAVNNPLFIYNCTNSIVIYILEV